MKDTATALPLAPGGTVLVARAGGAPKLAAQLPALRYAPLSFDALVGRWLRPHTSGRHVALRGLALLASAAQCSGLAPPAVLARLHDGVRDSSRADFQPPNTAPEHELPPLLVQPRECPALLAALALPPAGLQLLAYLRPGLALGGLGAGALAALRGGAPPGAPGLSALHALPAPAAALVGYTSCLLRGDSVGGGGSGGSQPLSWPTLSQAATAEVSREVHVCSGCAAIHWRTAACSCSGVSPTLACSLSAYRAAACGASSGSVMPRACMAPRMASSD